MKLFDIDWANGFLAHLPAWDKVPLAGRGAFLKLKPSGSVKTDFPAATMAVLVEAGFVQAHLGGAKVSVAEDTRAFSRVMRAMDRHRLHDAPSWQAMEAYIRDHFSREERAALLVGHHRAYYAWRDLLTLACSVEWIERFLSAKNSKAWAKGTPSRDEAGFFPKGRVFGKTKKLVRVLVKRRSPPSFSELQAMVPGTSPELFGECILAAHRNLLLFPSLRGEDLEPVIGAWLGIVERMTRAPARKPSEVTPDETFRASFLADDVTSFLVACAAEPLRLRMNDHRLFAKSQKQLEGSLVRLPPWVETVVRRTPPERASTVLKCCRAMKLVHQTEIDGKPFVTASPEAMEWLALSSHERLRSFVDRVKKIDARDVYSRMSGDFAFPPLGYAISLNRRGKFDVPSATVEAFKGIKGSKFISMTQFLVYHAERANPLIETTSKGQRRKIRIGWRNVESTCEELESLWADLLVGYLRLRLVPLGGVELGVDAKGEHCFAVTSVGRYLLGTSDDFDCVEEQACELVVQPNFEVMFMSPSPGAEAEIGRFAERIGSGVGALFKITRESVFAAGGAGLTADGTVESLRRFATKPVPANVEREIRGWFDRCRHLSISSAVLIRCPDPETAARVIAAAGKRKIIPVSDTVLELRDTARKAILLRKLRAQGLFVDLQD